MALAFLRSNLEASLKLKVVVEEPGDGDDKDGLRESLLYMSSQKISQSTLSGSACSRPKTDSSVV